MELKFQNLGVFSNWKVNMVDFCQPQNKWYCVGQGNNAGNMPNLAFEPWTSQDFEGWSFKMITFDNQGNMWCVGQGGNIAEWNKVQWNKDGPWKNWNAKMITFDGQGNMWSVGTGNNYGEWKGNSWVDHGKPANWNLKWIAFRPGYPDEIYCVGEGNNLGIYNIQNNTMTDVSLNMELVMITFSTDGNTAYIVDPAGEVAVHAYG